MKEVLVAALLWATPIAKTSTCGNTLISIIKEKKESRTTTKKKKERKEKTLGKKENNQIPDPTIGDIEVCNFYSRFTATHLQT